MYKLYDYKGKWVLIVRNDIIKKVLKDYTHDKWVIGENYHANERDTLIAESKDLKKLIEIGMLHVL